MVCTNGSRVSDVRRKHSELAGIGSSPSNAHYSRKSKRLVRPHLSCRDRVKGEYSPQAAGRCHTLTIAGKRAARLGGSRFLSRSFASMASAAVSFRSR